MSAESGEQLVSFFLYSMLIYPITNYIVSPKRRYPKWKAALYAIGFLGLVSTIHLVRNSSLNIIFFFLVYCYNSCVLVFK